MLGLRRRAWHQRRHRRCDLLGINTRIEPVHAPIEVRAGGTAAHAGQGDHVALLDVLAFADQQLRQVQEGRRSEEHTSELQSLMRISYAVFCLKKKKKIIKQTIKNYSRV